MMRARAPFARPASASASAVAATSIRRNSWPGCTADASSARRASRTTRDDARAVIRPRTVGERASERRTVVTRATASTISDEVARQSAKYLPQVLQSATGLTVGEVLAYATMFSFSLMFAVGALRPALVVMHEGFMNARRTAEEKRRAFEDSFFGFLYKLGRGALFNVGLAFVYTIIVPIASPDAHQLLPPDRVVRMLKIFYYGSVVTSIRKTYLATAAGALRRRMYGSKEPRDLIPGHVYDRESAALIWGITSLAALDSLGVPLRTVLQIIGASGVVLGILASVVLRDTIANYFGGLIVIAAGWFIPKEVVRVLIGGRREISGRVESIGYLYTKLINRAGKIAYIPNSAMVAYKVENLSRAPYREFREQFAISFDDLPKVPHLQTQVESFLRSTVGADVVRGVSLAPRCTLTGMNSFAGGAVLEIVCYNEYATFRNAGFTTMRLRHHIFLGLSRIFESTGVKFAIAGSIPSGESLSELLDTSRRLGSVERESRQRGRRRHELRRSPRRSLRLGRSQLHPVALSPQSSPPRLRFSLFRTFRSLILDRAVRSYVIPVMFRPRVGCYTAHHTRARVACVSRRRRSP